ncbi:Homeobox protein egl-5 [Aphelenchoides besseyi]|nr:Homeobox protein egl-5 [Aphelenchoides besseyi]KAI6201097.1 Homeobox protein egl-5 [Aphelenchoides besseyi]
MNASSTSTTPGNVGASTASSSSSPFANDYMNGNNSSLHHQQRPASSSRSNAASTSGLGNGTTIPNNQLASSSKSTTSTPSLMPPGTDHLQRLAQITDGLGAPVKVEGDSSSSNASAAAPAGGLSIDYHNAAAAYMQYNWSNSYYQPFNQPMNPGAAFSGWAPTCYTPAQWQNYAQTKKGRQTYQRYQTSVLEGKFQVSSYVSKKQREELRLQTNLTDRQIKIWFQNRRMKAKKEKNRCDDQSDHATLLPSSNSAKSLNDSLSSLGTNSNAGNGNAISGNLGGMLGGQHVSDELLGLMEQDDKQLKVLQNMHGHVTPSAMWMPGTNVHAVASMGMHDQMQMTWQQFLPQNQHQSNQYGMTSYGVPYPLCPSNS